MFDIGWSELLVILVVILIVVGPKDLPRVVRTFGQWSGKARSYARDFQRTIEEAADESEMAAIRKEIEVANRELAEVTKTSVKLDEPAGDPQAAQFASGTVTHATGSAPAPEPSTPTARPVHADETASLAEAADHPAKSG
jgi:sec-independent protein translocase protein TatB